MSTWPIFRPARADSPSPSDEMLQVCRWLELGLVVDWKEFPGFREAFDTGEVAWDIDPAPFRRRVGEIYQGVNCV